MGATASDLQSSTTPKPKYQGYEMDTPVTFTMSPSTKPAAGGLNLSNETWESMNAFGKSN